MIIEIKVGTDCNDYETQEMAIDGKPRLYVNALCECPEDAIIGRDLVSCKAVSSFMMEAYNAGKNGEEFSVNVTEAP
jgi:hypothetical protein